jgi:hypothetical protein
MVEKVGKEILVEGAQGAPEKAGGREALHHPLSGFYAMISPRI